MAEKKKIIIFVCTGNTCRSPMAEAIFRSEIRRKKMENIEVFSAGISPDNNGNTNVNPKTALVLEENGLSVINFSSKKLSTDNMENAFAIICMTDKQRDIVVDMRWTALREKGLDNFDNNVYSFSEFCGYEIPDPYGCSEEVYRDTFSSISLAMRPIFDKLFPEDIKKAEEGDSTIAPTQPTPKKRGRPKKSATSPTSKKQPSTRKKSGTSSSGSKTRKTQIEKN